MANKRAKKNDKPTNSRDKSRVRTLQLLFFGLSVILVLSIILSLFVNP